MPNIIQRKTVEMVHSENIVPLKYAMNDLGSVYTHYNPKTGKNEPTENILKGGNANETSTK